MSEVEMWERWIFSLMANRGRQNGRNQREKTIHGWSKTSICSYPGKTAVTAPLQQCQKAGKSLTTSGPGLRKAEAAEDNNCGTSQKHGAHISWEACCIGYYFPRIDQMCLQCIMFVWHTGGGNILKEVLAWIKPVLSHWYGSSLKQRFKQI